MLTLAVTFWTAINGTLTVDSQGHLAASHPSLVDWVFLGLIILLGLSGVYAMIAGFSGSLPLPGIAKAEEEERIKYTARWLTHGFLAFQLRFEDFKDHDTFTRWDDQVHDLILKAFGHAEAAQFRNEQGMPSKIWDSPDDRLIELRKIRLGELLGRLPQLELLDGFEPISWTMNGAKDLVLKRP